MLLLAVLEEAAEASEGEEPLGQLVLGDVVELGAHTFEVLLAVAEGLRGDTFDPVWVFLEGFDASGGIVERHMGQSHAGGGVAVGVALAD